MEKEDSYKSTSSFIFANFFSSSKDSTSKGLGKYDRRLKIYNFVSFSDLFETVGILAGNLTGLETDEVFFFTHYNYESTLLMLACLNTCITIIPLPTTLSKVELQKVLYTNSVVITDTYCLTKLVEFPSITVILSEGKPETRLKCKTFLSMKQLRSIVQSKPKITTIVFKVMSSSYELQEIEADTIKDTLTELIDRLDNIKEFTDPSYYLQGEPAYIQSFLFFLAYISLGVKTGISSSPLEDFFDNCRSLRPTCFSGRKVLLDRIRDSILERIDKLNESKKEFIQSCFEIRRKSSDSNDSHVSETLVFSKIKRVLGGRLAFIFTDFLDPLNAKTEEFFKDILAVEIKGYFSDSMVPFVAFSTDDNVKQVKELKTVVATETSIQRLNDLSEDGRINFSAVESVLEQLDFVHQIAVSQSERKINIVVVPNMAKLHNLLISQGINFDEQPNYSNEQIVTVLKTKFNSIKKQNNLILNISIGNLVVTTTKFSPINGLLNHDFSKNRSAINKLYTFS